MKETGALLVFALTVVSLSGFCFFVFFAHIDLKDPTIASVVTMVIQSYVSIISFMGGAYYSKAKEQ